MDNISFFVIKPDGYPHRLQILGMIQEANLYPTEMKIRKTKNSMIRLLYPEADRKKLTIRRQQYLNSDGELGTILLGIVLGENALEKLKEITGESIDPAKCKPGTIRCEFGIHQPIITIHNDIIYRNAIHRPKTKEELAYMLEFFHSL
jgi:nucleoside diphosphate kinase